MAKKARVGMKSKRDQKKPTPKPVKRVKPAPAPAPVAPNPDDVADGNKPVDAQPEQSERERLRPIDQP